MASTSWSNNGPRLQRCFGLCKQKCMLILSQIVVFDTVIRVAVLCCALHMNYRSWLIDVALDQTNNLSHFNYILILFCYFSWLVKLRRENWMLRHSWRRRVLSLKSYMRYGCGKINTALLTEKSIAHLW